MRHCARTETETEGYPYDQMYGEGEAANPSFPCCEFLFSPKGADLGGLTTTI
jgi:hypothetical protein